ncbi:6-phosphogluconolactonase [Pedobacter sp. PACM 27299]|uniref:lactonase family protein n=1 Tax=Pedobacter sp. PACM 27299 TaxID=1727164 RepID=UPI000706DEC7|nr:lactonase family protein [Pedobacter sp. PACM 27299]ALL08265.1 6-phosphogluconolactonase [Pedobacter sp. PACM 27299]
MKKLLFFPVIMLALQSCAQKKDYNLIVGTYTNTGKSEGIYVYDFDTNTAAVKAKTVTKNVENPSYLALGDGNKAIYAVNETSETSAVSAFGFDAASGKLTFLNKQATNGADPCYVIADKKNVITANYSGGSISVFGIEKDASLSAIKQLVKHTGKSIDKARQGSSHVHMAQFTPDHKYVVVDDLGTDKVYLYAYNPDGGNKVLTVKDSISITPGAGPRHLVFSKDSKYAYLIHEIDGGITVFSYSDGNLTEIQKTKITEDGFKGENGAADIHLSPDGKFLYASNRGSENKITIFAIEKGGLLSVRGYVSTLGKGPRNFAIDPTGKYLLVAHQYTNDVVIFERNLETGALKDTGKRISVGAPVCLVFAPVK